MGYTYRESPVLILGPRVALVQAAEPQCPEVDLPSPVGDLLQVHVFPDAHGGHAHHCWFDRIPGWRSCTGPRSDPGTRAAVHPLMPTVLRRAAGLDELRQDPRRPRSQCYRAAWLSVARTWGGGLPIFPSSAR
jgi:hypothetical protein